MSCRRKQCEKHGLEHWKSRRECCRASRETALRKSVWDAVFQEISPLLSPVVPFLAQETIVCFSGRKSPSRGKNKAGSRRFFPKKVYYGGAPGLESGEIEKDNISITYALPFSRTIPVRTPQSASRTEVSRPLCHGRAPLTAGRTCEAYSAPSKGVMVVAL